MRDRPCIGEDAHIVHLQNLRKLRYPVAHIHHFLGESLGLREGEELLDQEIELLDFSFVQIVLRHTDIVFADFPAVSLVLPSRETHMGSIRIRPLVHYLRCRMSMYRPVKFVLYLGKKSCRRLVTLLIVRARLVYLPHLVVEVLLARADVSYPLKELVEIEIVVPHLFETSIVHGETLDDILPQSSRRPDAKLSTTMGFHAVADGYNHIEIVVFKLSLHPSFSLQLNCSEFPNSCRLNQFSLFVDMAYVLADGCF